MPGGFHGNIHSQKWVLCKWESLLRTIFIHFQRKYLYMQSYSCYSRVIICGTKLMNCLSYNVTSCLWKSLCIIKRVNLRMPQWIGQVDQMRGTNIAELQWGNSTAWKLLESLSCGRITLRQIFGGEVWIQKTDGVELCPLSCEHRKWMELSCSR